MSNEFNIKASQIILKPIIELPISKSISNRQLMIYTYANLDINKLDISSADDSQMLRQLLNEINENETHKTTSVKEIYCKNAGTVSRFLLPLLSLQDNKYLLNASERMKQRPIKPLVDALRQMGASFDSLDQKLPLVNSPAQYRKSVVDVDISNSSQFASAILMMMPAVFEKSTINLKGDLTSLPYIKLTLELMRNYGICYSLDGREISLSGKYSLSNKEYIPERDWSSASYFYELLALKGEGKMILNGLQLNSIQGDKRLAHIFESLGVHSEQLSEGVLIQSTKSINYNQNIDFEDIPDLAPAIICSCAALGVIGKFTGLQSLNFKESRRMDVLCSELAKLGYDLRDNGMDEYILINSCKPQERNADFSNVTINTANDHRMAMAFSPFALVGKSINITDAQSVEKSFPDFWKELL